MMPKLPAANSRIRGLTSLHRALVSGLISFLLPIGIAQLIAAEGRANAPKIKPLEVEVQPGEIVGNEQIIRLRLRSGTNEFMLMLPPGARSETPAGGTLNIADPKGAYRIELRLLAADPTEDLPPQLQRLKTKLLEAHPKAARTEEFSVNVGRAALGQQFSDSMLPFGERLYRVIWVPGPAGILEFSLNAAASQGRAAVQTLDTLLVTLRTNEKGKLEITRRLERS
jgi:hypothetical protein